MKVGYSARSHVGRNRNRNEDNLFADGVILSPEMRDFAFSIDGSSIGSVVLAVCDGMGGEESGDVASLVAVRRLTEISESLKVASETAMEEIVQNYAMRVHDELQFISGGENGRTGTTLAMAVINQSGVWCFNVGDTRIYCLKGKKFTQVTNDHTLAAEQVRNGIIPSEEARWSKDRHKLTKCLGIGKQHSPENYPTIFGRCRLIICSDGLTDMVAKSEIKRILSESERCSQAADYLLHLALEHGGVDNITVIVADIVPSSLQQVVNRFRKRRKL